MSFREPPGGRLPDDPTAVPPPDSIEPRGEAAADSPVSATRSPTAARPPREPASPEAIAGGMEARPGDEDAKSLENVESGADAARWTFRTPIRVRYAETDQMRFVYHANHLVYWEVARTEFFAASGHPYHELEEQGLAVPVLEAHCQYLSPARYGDDLTIHCRAAFPDGLRLRFEYETRRGEDGPVLACGWTLHVFMDPSGRPKRPPRTLVEEFRQRRLLA